MGYQRNVASPPARTLPLSVGWDAIHPPRRHHCCHCRAAISTVAHPRYPPDADPGHARRRVSCCRHRRCRPLPPLPAASRGRRNSASLPARASPLSAGWWDAICPIRRHCHCCRHALSLLPSRHNLRRCPFPVSARRGPRTCPSRCSSSTPSSTSPSPPSAHRRLQDRSSSSLFPWLLSSSSSRLVGGAPSSPLPPLPPFTSLPPRPFCRSHRSGSRNNLRADSSTMDVRCACPITLPSLLSLSLSS